MNKSDAIAEIFYTAFQALPRKEQARVLLKLIHNKHSREDLLDLALAEERRKEKGRPFRKFLAEIEHKTA